MAMIEINIHIPIDGVNNISIPIQLPVVPRVGEKIYLSDKQINNLIKSIRRRILPQSTNRRMERINKTVHQY